jgi:soluble lytic murein transglycosylase-like protein
MYLVGRGVVQNSGTAGQWFLLAASHGSQHAKNLVIRLGVSGEAQSVDCSHDASTAAIRAPKDIEAKVNEMAPQFNLDPKLVLAVIQVESGFRPDAVSPKGARGLMQLLPATAKRFDVAAIENVDDNLKGGMRYLQWLLARFDGSVRLALAAYNAGEERIVAFHGVPPFPETVEYVERIRALYPSAQHRIH